MDYAFLAIAHHLTGESHLPPEGFLIEKDRLDDRPEEILLHQLFSEGRQPRGEGDLVCYHRRQSEYNMFGLEGSLICTCYLFSKGNKKYEISRIEARRGTKPQGGHLTCV